jgi:hypothetical protein
MTTFKKLGGGNAADYRSTDDRFVLFIDYAPRLRKSSGLGRRMGYTLREVGSGREWPCESMAEARKTADAIEAALPTTRETP